MTYFEKTFRSILCAWKDQYVYISNSRNKNTWYEYLGMKSNVTVIGIGRVTFRSTKLTSALYSTYDSIGKCFFFM